jgi:hypothetical protein
VVLLVIWQAMRWQSLVRPDGATLAVAAALAGLAGVAAVAVLRRRRRPTASSRSWVARGIRPL